MLVPLPDRVAFSTVQSTLGLDRSWVRSMRSYETSIERLDAGA
jgi:hypothetical protein